tara:strand:+ start:516 stop:905 length:390 start_codon:yes stop_codon:yes gene_type:complete
MNSIDMNSGEKLTYSGCYAMSEDEFGKEFDNFVLNGNTLTLDKDGLQLSIHYYRGDEESGELPTLTPENFFVLSKETAQGWDDSLLEFDCYEDEAEAMKAKGFQSLVNIDAIYWHERLESKLLEIEQGV